MKKTLAKIFHTRWVHIEQNCSRKKKKKKKQRRVHVENRKQFAGRSQAITDEPILWCTASRANTILCSQECPYCQQTRLVNIADLEICFEFATEPFDVPTIEWTVFPVRRRVRCNLLAILANFSRTFLYFFTFIIL